MAPRRSPSRWLAPLSIIVVAAIALSILNSDGSAGDGDGRSSGRPGTTTTTQSKPKPRRRSYVVRSGDTLSSISIETGVSVARLESLNPDLDVQALQPGQKLKLR